MDAVIKDWKRAVGFGALIWIIIFVVVSAFIGFGVAENIIFRLIVIAVAWGLAYFLAGKIGIRKPNVGLQYGIVFVAVGLILDAIITVRFTGAEIFSDLLVWLGYLGVLLAPVVYAQKKV